VFHRPIVCQILATIVALAFLASPVAAAAQSGGSANPQQMTRSALSSQLDASFATLDTNKDKNLNKSEVEAAQARNVAQAQATIAKRIEAEFAKLDGNKDGQLSLSEFKGAAPTPKAPPVDELMKQLDRNSDGKVSQDEYRALPLGNFDRLDTNKDGTISAQEQAAAKAK
jgi:Ca2+-binding EF-hand superfamily protein